MAEAKLLGQACTSTEFSQFVNTQQTVYDMDFLRAFWSDLAIQEAQLHRLLLRHLAGHLVRRHLPEPGRPLHPRLEHELDGVDAANQLS